MHGQQMTAVYMKIYMQVYLLRCCRCSAASWRFTASTRAAVPMLAGGPHSGRARHSAWPGWRGSSASFHTREKRGRSPAAAAGSGARQQGSIVLPVASQSTPCAGKQRHGQTQTRVMRQ